MPQFGYRNGVDLDPSVMDYLMKKKNPEFKAGRAQGILQQLEEVRGRQASPEYQGMMAASTRSDPMMDMMPAIAKASAQFGTIRGQTADTSAVDEMANAMEKRRQQQAMLGGQARQATDAYDKTRLSNAVALDEMDQNSEKLAATKAKEDRDYAFKNKEFQQKQDEIALRKQESDNSYATTLEGVDELGNPVSRVLNKKGGVMQTFAGNKSGSGGTNYDAKLKGLNAQQLIRFDSASMGLNATMDMQKALQGGSNTFSLIGDNPYTMARTKFEEAIGRMQSGGAITDDEGERFLRMAPSVKDSVPIQRAKMKQLLVEMSSRIKNLGFNPDEVLSKRAEIENSVSKYDLKDAPDPDQAYAAPVAPEQFKAGEVRDVKGKPWKYIGNDQWEEVE